MVCTAVGLMMQVQGRAIGCCRAWNDSNAWPGVGERKEEAAAARSGRISAALSTTWCHPSGGAAEGARFRWEDVGSSRSAPRFMMHLRRLWLDSGIGGQPA